MTRTEKERQEGRPPTKKSVSILYELALVACDHACIRYTIFRLEPDFRLQSNKDRLLLYELWINDDYTRMSYIILILFISRVKFSKS